MDGLLQMVDIADANEALPLGPFDRLQARRGHRPRPGRAAPVHPLRRADHHGGPRSCPTTWATSCCASRSQLRLTSIVVTHDLDLMYKVADRVVFLFEGSGDLLRPGGGPGEIRASAYPRISGAGPRGEGVAKRASQEERVAPGGSGSRRRSSGFERRRDCGRGTARGRLRCGRGFRGQDDSAAGGPAVGGRGGFVRGGASAGRSSCGTRGWCDAISRTRWCAVSRRAGWNLWIAG